MKTLKIFLGLMLSVFVASDVWASFPYAMTYTPSAGNTILADHLNTSNNEHINSNIPENIDDYSVNATEMQATTDPYPAASESLAVTLDGELQRIRYVIAQITQEAQWYIDPPTFCENSANFDHSTFTYTTGGQIILDVDGTGTNTAGSLNFGVDKDAAMYWDGSRLVGTSTGQIYLVAASGFEVEGIVDFGTATSFEVPNNATPTVDKIGEFALDTTVTGYHQGLMTYFGTEANYIVSFPTDTLTTTNGHILAYNSTDDQFEMIANSSYARDLIINSWFEVNQRIGTQTAYTSTTTPDNGTDTYHFDRWYTLSDGEDVIDISQESNGGVSGSETYYRADVETAQKKFALVQIIEHKNIKSVSGGSEVVSLSFEATVSNATKLSDIRAAVLSWSGAADSVTSDVISAWGDEAGTLTYIANITEENTAADLSVTTSWVKYEIENIAIDTTAMQNLIVFLYQNNVATNDTTGVFLDVTGVHLQKGANASTIEHRDYATELATCKRYYEELNNEALESYNFGAAFNSDSTTSRAIIHYEVEKRAAATISVSDANHFDVMQANATRERVTVLIGAAPSKLTTQMTITTNGNLVAGDGTKLFDNDNGGARIRIDSEL